MRIISKHFATMRQAEAYQTRLYGTYDAVRLIRSPRFSEDGVYSWEVK